jgi:hypothetical protein
MSSGDLATSPRSLSFGNVAMGSSSSQRLTLTNSGMSAYTITQAVASGGRFTVKGPPLPLTLAEGQSATFTTSFAPTAVGSATGSLSITSTRTQLTSAPENGSSVRIAPMVTTQQATITMIGTGVPLMPSITVQPSSQTVIAGQTATFSVTSSGAAPLSYQWSKNGTAIIGATSSSYTTPNETASDTGAQFKVEVSNSGGSLTSASAILTVNATSPGRLTAGASSLNFHNVNVGSGSVLSLRFSNTGSSNITVSNVSISGAGYNASGMTAGLILTPGQTATLNVTFTPAATGTLTGAVNVTSDASDSIISVNLLGTGIQPGAHLATLAWPASTAPTVTGYNVYRATVSGGYSAPLNSSVIPASTTQFEDSTVQSGRTYYYVFTIVDSSNGQSPFSNEVSGTIPTP